MTQQKTGSKVIFSNIGSNFFSCPNFAIFGSQWKKVIDELESYNFISKFVFSKVIKDRFIELFKPNVPEYSIEGSNIFTYYNPYNVTSRPTNAFNSVNFYKNKCTRKNMKLYSISK